MKLTFLKIFPRNSHTFKITSYFYHELKFLLQNIIIKINHKKIKIYRLQKKEVNTDLTFYKSQFGQDYFVEKIFSNLNIKKEQATFLDIGCNHPIKLSNSYYFEKQGWRIIAIDPIEKFKESWDENRPLTKFINAAISCEEGEEDFTIYEGDLGWENALSTFKKYERNHDKVMKSKVVKVKKQNLRNCLESHNIKDKAFDIMSIDVEGSEQDVLNGIDFNFFDINIIILENTNPFYGSKNLRNYLSKKGYSFYARIWTADDIYIKNTLLK
ncbi:methyltransferase, FkbM family [Thiothrix caldifontis]|uniref:Methyltransferase, FkbM family n=1 Tax=Thiothrix caldifontis TaxID=525918 RepID=A0A1H4DLA2_9GAMM|nr:FkbM family methyltransferase [Thiothrix caldifontis]SEA73535.1 methyltransferase, FkbM family [Thiothrix caldifontis]